jgi:hypothetical protein
VRHPPKPTSITLCFMTTAAIRMGRII